MKLNKYFLSTILLLGLIIWGLSGQSIKIVQANIKTAVPNKIALIKKPTIKKALVKKTAVKKTPLKKTIAKKLTIKKPPIKRATASIIWTTSGIKQLKRITNPFVRAAYKAKVEKYALGKKIKTITATVVNGMHE